MALNIRSRGDPETSSLFSGCLSWEMFQVEHKLSRNTDGLVVAVLKPHVLLLLHTPNAQLVSLPQDKTGDGQGVFVLLSRAAGNSREQNE